MAGQASDCDYCNSYIPQDYAPDDMDSSSVLEILQNVLYENANGEKQYNKWNKNIPHIPQELFTYAPDEEQDEEYDEGYGKKNRKNKSKHKKHKKHKKGTRRYQRGGGARRRVAQIMTLIVYTAIIYYGLPYIATGLKKLELLLVSSGLLPKLCGSLEEVAAVLTPGDNVCRLKEASYNRMIDGISGSIVALAASWGYVRGNIWTTAKRDWNALTDKFENMLKTFENNKAVDIVSGEVDMEGETEKKVEGLENAKYLAVLYKNELEDARLDEEMDMDIGVLSMIDEPDSQDHGFGPDYYDMEDASGHRHRKHRTTIRRGRSRGRSRGRGRGHGRGRSCMVATRRR